jgi:2',3'-cyclic-nucleotide 2'-phosphodiesterase (5'-nucleotidase family)
VRRLELRILCLLVLTACGGATETPGAAEIPAPPPRRVVLSVVGTNDLHGHLRALPYLGGYLRALRDARRDDGGVLLLDGGDMFQGTLESNLAEGAPVVRAYEALGYDAVTIGNHEFDYGPVGERATPAEPGDDPRGALIARATESDFPFLSANLLSEASGERVEWSGVTPSVLIPKAGVVVGVIGVTTEETLTTTLAANVSDLRMAPLAREVVREAESLRARGADAVIVAAHAGGHCERFDDPRDLSSCDASQEIFEVARQLPEGAVDAIVAGHTHRAVAHFVNGVPVVESYAYGEAFGRIDLVLQGGEVVDTRVHPPQRLCASGSLEGGDCAPGDYESRPVTPDEEVAARIEPAIARAAELTSRPLGVELADRVVRSRTEESALGNLFVDLMRAAREDVDVALTNGGGLRADLPAGPLTYGALYQANPFDNRFARVRLSGAELREVIAAMLRDDGSFFSLSGVRVRARCEGSDLEVALRDEEGAPIEDDATLTLLTSDFLATGGDGLMGHVEAGDDAVVVDEGELVRDAMARVLSERGGTLDPTTLYDPDAPRLQYPGERPVSCAEAP